MKFSREGRPPTTVQPVSLTRAHTPTKPTKHALGPVRGHTRRKRMTMGEFFRKTPNGHKVGYVLAHPGGHPIQVADRRSGS